MKFNLGKRGEPGPAGPTGNFHTRLFIYLLAYIIIKGLPGDQGEAGGHCPSSCGVQEMVGPSVAELDTSHYQPSPQATQRGGY